MVKEAFEPNEDPREEVILSWSSMSRVFKRRSKEFYTNVAALAFLPIVVLLIAKEFAFILVIISVVFFLYVIYTVPPEEVRHRINNLGIESAGHFYRYEMLHEFWFDEQWGQNMLVLRPYYGARIIVLLGSQDKEEVRTILAKYIPFREQPDRTWVDNAARWLSLKIPLEKPVS